MCDSASRSRLVSASSQLPYAFTHLHLAMLVLCTRSEPKLAYAVSLVNHIRHAHTIEILDVTPPLRWVNRVYHKPLGCMVVAALDCRAQGQVDFEVDTPFITWPSRKHGNRGTDTRPTCCSGASGGGGVACGCAGGTCTAAPSISMLNKHALQSHTHVGEVVFVGAKILHAWQVGRKPH